MLWRHGLFVHNLAENKLEVMHRADNQWYIRFTDRVQGNVSAVKGARELGAVIKFGNLQA